MSAKSIVTLPSDPIASGVSASAPKFMEHTFLAGDAADKAIITSSAFAFRILRVEIEVTTAGNNTAQLRAAAGGGGAAVRSGVIAAMTTAGLNVEAPGASIVRDVPVGGAIYLLRAGQLVAGTLRIWYV